MDRFKTMIVFVAVLDEGSRSDAVHTLGRSSAAVSLARADLEARLGVELLHRTIRSIRLLDAGERSAQARRSILAALDKADMPKRGPPPRCG